MWPFKQTPETQEEKALRERVELLESAMRRLDEEWTEVYHKFRVLQMRVAKQVQKLDEASPDEGGTRPNGGEEHSPLAGPGSSLSSRQLQVQREILARRNRKEG